MARRKDESIDEFRARRAAYMREWVARNREAVNAKKLERLHADQAAMQRARENARAWAAANPERARDARARGHANRKARRLGIDGKLSVGIFSRLLVEQRGLCATCGDDMTVAGVHLDHVVPFAKRGPNTDDNVRLLCPGCNVAKGALDDAEFRRLLAERRAGGVHG